jgi:hypothetical protein
MTMTDTLSDRYAIKSLDVQLHGARYAVIDTKDDPFGLDASIIVEVESLARAIRIRDGLNAHLAGEAVR